MCEKADVGIAIYIVYDKDMKTKRKKLFWMKDWFEKITQFLIITFTMNFDYLFCLTLIIETIFACHMDHTNFY